MSSEVSWRILPDICFHIHSMRCNLLAFSIMKGQSYCESLNLSWMSEANARQQSANVFSKLVCDPHTIVIQHGSSAVSTSTRQICFNDLGSSFQCNVIQIMITESSLLIALGNSSNPRELYVSMSHVRTSVRSLISAEIGKRFFNDIRSSTGQKFSIDTRKVYTQSRLFLPPDSHTYLLIIDYSD